MAYLVPQELPELSRGGIATGKRTVLRRGASTERNVRTVADARVIVERAYPGFVAYGPLGECIPPGTAAFIALSVYSSKSKDGVGRSARDLEMWRVVPKK